MHTFDMGRVKEFFRANSVEMLNILVVLKSNTGCLYGVSANAYIVRTFVKWLELD